MVYPGEGSTMALMSKLVRAEFIKLYEQLNIEFYLT